MSTPLHRPLESLPVTELPWLKIHDHFIATVGAHSGRGRALGPLLVLADATFAPRSRFPIHPHQDMEIVTVVVDGEVSHHGNQAHDSVVKARGIQLISARSGMVHAEGNDTDHPTRMLQVWFQPSLQGGAPAYFQRDLPPSSGPGRHVVAGDEGMPLRADALVEWLDLAPGRETALQVRPGRGGYLLALGGPFQAGAARLLTGEGLQVPPGELRIQAEQTSAALWIDVAV